MLQNVEPEPKLQYLIWILVWHIFWTRVFQFLNGFCPSMPPIRRHVFGCDFWTGMVFMVCPTLAGEGVLHGLRGECRPHFQWLKCSQSVWLCKFLTRNVWCFPLFSTVKPWKGEWKTNWLVWGWSSRPYRLCLTLPASTETGEPKAKCKKTLNTSAIHAWTMAIGHFHNSFLPIWWSWIQPWALAWEPSSVYPGMQSGVQKMTTFGRNQTTGMCMSAKQQLHWM